MGMERRKFLRLLGLAPAAAVGTASVALTGESITREEQAAFVASIPDRAEYLPPAPLAPWLVELMDDPDRWAREKAQQTIEDFRSGRPGIESPLMHSFAEGAPTPELATLLREGRVGDADGWMFGGGHGG